MGVNVLSICLTYCKHVLTKYNPHSVTFPPKCIYTTANHRITKQMQVGKKIPTTDLPDPGLSCIFISIQIGALRYFTTEKTAFCLRYLRHNFETAADQIALLEGTWEATVKLMKLKGSMCNRRPVQTSIILRCERPQQIKTSLSCSQ